MRRGFWLPLVLAAGLLGLASPSAASARMTADSQLARNVMLTRSDLGTGWSSTPAASGRPFVCVRSQTGTRLPGPAAGARSRDFSAGQTGPFVEQIALTYRTLGAAGRFWRAVTSGGLVNCMTQSLNSESLGDIHFQVVASLEHTISVRGARTFGHEFRVSESAGGESTSIYLDLLLLERGRLVSLVSVSSLGSPALPSTEWRLESAVARRLRQNVSPS